jgi:hypothetical protein
LWLTRLRRRSDWQAAFLLQPALTSTRPADKTRALFRQAVSFASRNGRPAQAELKTVRFSEAWLDIPRLDE